MFVVVEGEGLCSVLSSELCFGRDEMTWRHGQWTVTGRVGIWTPTMI